MLFNIEDLFHRLERSGEKGQSVELQSGHNDKGFSLVELLMAITLLAIGLFAVAGMQTVAMNANTIANKISVSSSIAQEVMEDIISWPQDSPSLNTTAANIVYDLDKGSAATTITVTGAGTFSATYSTTTSTPISGMTQIAVRVTCSGIQPVIITSYKRLT